MDGTKTYVATSAIATRLSVHPETVRRWVRAGSIPHIRIAGVIRFDPAAVDAWCAEHQQGTDIHAVVVESREAQGLPPELTEEETARVVAAVTGGDHRGTK